jgi:hypothetical protein
MHDFWKSVILKSVGPSFDISVAALAATMFKKKLSVSDSIEIANKEGWDIFKKLGVARQKEFLSHCYFLLHIDGIEYTLKDILGDNTIAKQHVLSYITDAEQSFPVYSNLPEHIEMCSIFFKSMCDIFLPHYFDNEIVSVKTKQFVKGSLLHKLNNLSSFDNIDPIDIQIIKTIEDDNFILKLLRKSIDNDQASFVLQTGQSTLSSLSSISDCIVSNVLSNDVNKLNRREISISEEMPEYVVTIFNLNKVAVQLKKNVFINKTSVDIVNKLLDFDIDI